MSFVASIEMETIECYNCRMPFAMSVESIKRLRKTHDGFYCPSGHFQAFHGLNNEEKLKASLETVRQEKEEALRCCSALEITADKLERSVRGYKGKITQMQNSKLKQENEQKEGE